MAKVLDDLPAGLALKAPSGPSKTNPAAQKGQTRGRGSKALEPRDSSQGLPVPKARQRPGSGQRMNEYSEWMMRRCDAFGIASSRYFKKNQTCPRPKRET